MAQYSNGYAVNTRIPKATYDKLKNASRRSGLSMSHIIRDALEGSEHLNARKPAKKAKH